MSVKQTKLISLLESFSNTAIGLITSFIIQLLLYPSLGIKVSIGQNVVITLVFFGASIFRGYLVRRFFNNKQNNKFKNKKK